MRSSEDRRRDDARAVGFNARRRWGSGIDKAGVLAAIGDTLARFKQPRLVLFVDALPRNQMGKVQKAALRDAYKDLFRATADSIS